MRELLESLEEGRDRSNAESLDASRSALNMVKRAVAAVEAAKRMAFSPKSKKMLERALDDLGTAEDYVGADVRGLENRVKRGA